MLKEVFDNLPAAWFSVVKLRTKTWTSFVEIAKRISTRLRILESFHLGAAACARTRTLFVEWLAKLVNASQVFALGSFGFEFVNSAAVAKVAKTQH